MAGQGMDHTDFYYPEYEEPQSYSQSEPEWNIQNHGTNSPSFTQPISPSFVSFSAAQGYSVSAAVSPTDQYLSAGPPYGGYAAQRPPPSDPLHPGSEHGLTSRTTFYDPNSGVSGYSTAPTATQALQQSYCQQTFEHNTALSAAWDSRIEPSHRYTIPMYSGYQTAPGVQDLAERVIVQRQHQQALTNNRSSTMGDFLGPLEDDPNSSPKATRKAKHKDKRHGRANLNEPEQPGRKALPDSKRTKGPTLDSVNKRTSSSRGGNKAKSSPAVASHWGRSKFPLKNEYDDSEGAGGPEGSSDMNNTNGTSNGTTTTKTRHNMVEQKYRNRLNAHFDQLLEALPNTMSEIPGQLAAAAAMSSPEFQGQEDHHVGMSMSTSGAILQPVERERKVSKAEVLDRARLYIQSLENDARRLMADQEELKARFEEFSRRNQAKQGKGGGKY